MVDPSGGGPVGWWTRRVVDPSGGGPVGCLNRRVSDLVLIVAPVGFGVQVESKAGTLDLADGQILGRCCCQMTGLAALAILKAQLAGRFNNSALVPSPRSSGAITRRPGLATPSNASTSALLTNGKSAGRMRACAALCAVRKATAWRTALFKPAGSPSDKVTTPAVATKAKTAGSRLMTRTRSSAVTLCNTAIVRMTKRLVSAARSSTLSCPASRLLLPASERTGNMPQVLIQIVRLSSARERKRGFREPDGPGDAIHHHSIRAQ